MRAINSVSPIEFRKIWHVRYEAFDLSDSKASSQKSGEKSQQIKSDMVKIFHRFRESTDVRLDYEVNNNGKKISVRVINKSSGKVIREIPVKPEFKMDMPKGVICQTFT